MGNHILPLHKGKLVLLFKQHVTNGQPDCTHHGLQYAEFVITIHIDVNAKLSSTNKQTNNHHWYLSHQPLPYASPGAKKHFGNIGNSKSTFNVAKT